MKLILGFLVHHSFQRVSNIEPEDKVELEEVEKSIEEKLEDERVAWQYFGPGWTRVLDQIKREKDQRHHELLVIDRRKQKLSEWKKRLEQMQLQLTARETRILESEPFLAAAKKLQNLGIGIEQVLPFIETINRVRIGRLFSYLGQPFKLFIVMKYDRHKNWLYPDWFSSIRGSRIIQVSN